MFWMQRSTFIAIALVAASCGGSSTPAANPEPAADEPAPEKGYLPVAAIKPPPSVEVIGPATDYLADDFAQRYERRARVQRYGPVRLVLGGEPVAGERGNDAADLDFTEHVVAVDRGDFVRIIDDERSRRLLLWVERVDLARVPRYATLADVEPNEPPLDGTGVTLAAGAPIAIGAELDGYVYATVGDHVFEMKGWLSDSSLEQVYTPEPVTSPAMEHAITRSVPLLDNPGGRELGAFDVHMFEPDVQVVGGRDGYREVVYYGEHFVARGFVPDDAVKHVGVRGMGMMGTGSGGGFGITHRIRLTLPAGACLYEPDGEIVGVTTQPMDSYASIDEQDARWYVAVGSDWGIFDVVAYPDGELGSAANVPAAWRACD